MALGQYPNLHCEVADNLSDQNHLTGDASCTMDSSWWAANGLADAVQFEDRHARLVMFGSPSRWDVQSQAQVNWRGLLDQMISLRALCLQLANWFDAR